MAVAQLQLLNKILNTKDMSVLTLNNLGADYFFDYKSEFTYIKNHYDSFGVVPDRLTFVNTFPEFDLMEVSEPDSYLLDQLYKEYNQAYLAQRFNNIRTMLEADKVDEAVKYFTDSLDKLHQGGAMTCTNLLTDTSRFDNYMKRVNHISGNYLTTGFKELDAILGGIDTENENMVIAARSGRGKTQLLLKLATAASLAGKTVGIFEGEMTADKVGYRIDTFLGHMNNTAINRGDITVKHEYNQYIDSLKDANLGAIKVLTPNDVSGPVTVDTLKAFIEREHLEILFVDQYSLLEDTSKAKTTFEKVGNIARDIKKLQVEKQIPIVAVAQMNRTKNDDNVQDTNQIGLSDMIPQYATVLLMLEKEVLETEDGYHHTQLKINIVKARDGGDSNCLVYEVDFNKGIFTFIEEKATTKKQAAELKNKYSKQPTDGEVCF